MTIFPMLQKRKLGTNMNNLPKVTQLVSGHTGVRTLEIWPQSTVSNDTWHQQWDSDMYGNISALSCWVYLEQDCWFFLGFQNANSETHLLLSDSKNSARQFQYVGFPVHTSKAILWHHMGALQFNSVQTLPGDTIRFHRVSIQSHKTATLPSTTSYPCQKARLSPVLLTDWL